MSDVEVEVREITIADAIDDMVDGGLDKEEAHLRMRDAMRAINCTHAWQTYGPYADSCKKCGCIHVHDMKAHFGLSGEEGEA